ncbi:hypothetical protein THASP1DRAFT_33430 [Thamnocephalis sphaerospora]|uniref:VASt domain-containing protein n=1 Tax=Thamnocephalis sphaerospora TaxID=78915 RepID=A0A4P9XGK3_9FUNG|nr:hypothetical protein THASP1DRAFT_33430 [Thamnocephalis sphaerospora]|eukprot:RKP04766.1 hypothetical protein THASP1DRAFT_33430 [Thamnocephalis sphaerospora]
MTCESAVTPPVLTERVHLGTKRSESAVSPHHASHRHSFSSADQLMLPGAHGQAASPLFTGSSVPTSPTVSARLKRIWRRSLGLSSGRNAINGNTPASAPTSPTTPTAKLYQPLMGTSASSIDSPSPAASSLKDPVATMAPSSRAADLDSTLTTVQSAAAENRDCSSGRDTSAMPAESRPATLSREQQRMAKRFPDLAKDVHLLIESYSCKLQRDGIWHGRLYICWGMACFSGQLFSKSTREIIPFSEITAIDKETYLGLIPTAIRITLNDGQQRLFTGMIKRDAAWQVLLAAWQAYQRPSAQKIHRYSITSLQSVSSGESDKVLAMTSAATATTHETTEPGQSAAMEESLVDTPQSNGKHGAQTSANEQTSAVSLGRAQTDTTLVRTTPGVRDSRRTQSTNTRRRPLAGLFHRRTATDLASAADRRMAILTDATTAAPASAAGETDAADMSSAKGIAHAQLTDKRSCVNVFSMPSVSTPSESVCSDTETCTDEFGCACLGHAKHALLDVCLPLEPTEVLRAIFGEDENAVRECDRNQRWKRDESRQWTQRDVAYAALFEPPHPGKKQPITLEHQRVRLCDEEHTAYSVDVWTRFTGIPRADHFVVYTRWCITDAPAASGAAPTARLLVTCSVEFTKKLILRGNALERTAVESMRARVDELHTHLLAWIQQRSLRTKTAIKGQKTVRIREPASSIAPSETDVDCDADGTATRQAQVLGDESLRKISPLPVTKTGGKSGVLPMRPATLIACIFVGILVFTTAWNALVVVRMRERDALLMAPLSSIQYHSDFYERQPVLDTPAPSPEPRRPLHELSDLEGNLSTADSLGEDDDREQDSDERMHADDAFRTLLRLRTQVTRLKNDAYRMQDTRAWTHNTVWTALAKQLIAIPPANLAGRLDSFDASDDADATALEFAQSSAPHCQCPSLELVQAVDA